MNPIPSEQELAELLEKLDPEQMLRVFAYLIQLQNEDVD